MERKTYEVNIDINIYDKKLNINGVDIYKDLYETKNYIFNVMDICCVCAIDKAKNYLEDAYKGKYIEWLKIQAYEEPVISIFIKEDYDEYY